MNAGPEKMEILIVDDIPSNIKILGETLKSEYKIRSAKDGAKALELIERRQPDMVLLDIMMPDLDGYEVCKILKSREHTKHIPVIFISAMDDVKDETRGFELGAVDYITKPFKPVIVQSRIRAHMELKRNRMQLEKMVKECKIAGEEIRLLNQKLENQISDRTEKLNMAREEIIQQEYKSELADISTGTLHNVKNILSSVKTSCEVIKGGIRIPLDGLHKANGKLQARIDDFSSLDPKVEKIFQYYLMLEKIVQNETQKAGTHLNRLLEKVDMIEQIITAQQEYGRPDHMEFVSIQDMIDDAIMMQTDMINRYDVKIIKSYDDVPRICVQKAKIIHILINLIKNAVEAMSESAVEEKQLKLATGSIGDQVFVKITDNGCGIPPEKMKLLFSHGFTTKKNGHGFGLNSSARYMEEMGGELKAESGGKDKGATFTIMFPGVANEAQSRRS